MFRVHCFNKYGKNKNSDCPDLEVTYYIECSEKIVNEGSRMRREIDVPIICQHESINTPIPEKITTVTTETPNPFDKWTAPPEDSSIEQMMTTLNDGITEIFDTSFETFNWTAFITEMTSVNQDNYIYRG